MCFIPEKVNSSSPSYNWLPVEKQTCWHLHFANIKDTFLGGVKRNQSMFYENHAKKYEDDIFVQNMNCISRQLVGKSLGWLGFEPSVYKH